MKRLRVLFGLLALNLMVVMPAVAADYDLVINNGRVKDQVKAITAPLVGRVGFAAQLIGSDKIIAYNGDMTFPMASTYKVPAAVTLLKRVEAGEVKLDHMVELHLDDMVAGDNVIAENFVHP
ncbi:serine hydrolase, partial [Planctomycetota bacterium]